MAEMISICNLVPSVKRHESPQGGKMSGNARLEAVNRSIRSGDIQKSAFRGRKKKGNRL